MKCRCQDSYGNVCNKHMTKKEYKRDGMCASCASHVWRWVTNLTYKWKHANPEASK